MQSVELVINKMCCKSDKNKRNPKLTVLKRNDSKVVLLGDSGVGKSSIMWRYVKDEFSDAYDVTIGGSYMQSEIVMSNGEKAMLNIWDTAG